MATYFKTFELLLISIIVAIFIYYRTLDYYVTMPRLNMIVACMIAIWCFLCIAVNPWFIVGGLAILNIFGAKHEFRELHYSS